ncbi:E-selectin [Monodelphis domestica]|uniref:E-selectin n=1 Tax=Monodelphis domestica TaxID=13616 RepID=UPI0024E1E95F|nr:E-selectin [Monodelphis domestica]
MVSKMLTILSFLPGLIFAFLLFEQSDAWSYASSKIPMTYDKARIYCQKKYTDLVAIQNKKEIEYLNNILEFSPSYYWIGIRKINGVWTWVGTQKPLTKEAMNWAPNEPNNKQNNEDCVEIYIKREKASGMWNDERCTKEKRALCYTASCTTNSCNGHGECVETINDFTCQCYPGFTGFRCEHAVTCEPHADPENGVLVCSHPVAYFNSSCSVSCDEGYIPTNPNSVTCTSSGKWSGPSPSCKVIECDALTSPVHGFINCSPNSGTFPWNTTCVFDCESGFELTGSKRLHCSSSGKWDMEKPVCQAMKCSIASQPENGSVMCNHSSTGDFTYQSVCNFNCNEGFELQGSSQIECTAQGQWTHQSPTCGVIECDALTSPVHGFINCSPNSGTFPWNTTCVFDCESGFELTGSKRLHCSSSGKWDMEKPVCQAVKCSIASQPENGSVTCNHSSTGDFTYQSVCNFNCNEGFELQGSSQIECTAQGQWTHQSPTCEVIECDALTSPVHGFINCSPNSGTFPWNTTCVFDCESGFELTGSKRLHCSSSGKWDMEKPVCQAVKCSIASQPENGSVMCNHSSTGDFTYQSVCNFNCNEGFELQGSSQLECTAQGQWTHQSPTCEVVQCSALTVPKEVNMTCDGDGNYLYGTKCMFECPEGWKLNGSDSLICSAKGNWSGILPSCEAPEESKTSLAIGLATSGTSLLTTASVLLWLAKRLRRKVKKFIPASSCQTLKSDQPSYELI